MAGTTLLALIDDIATLLDDVAVLSKVAAKKTAGVLGDDLALSAEQVAGVKADRELPIVWAVAKGSLKNKCFLIPGAMLISAIAPWAVTLLLMIGGLYLCYEGAEKVIHRFWPTPPPNSSIESAYLGEPGKSAEDIEQAKIKGAIRTDFILSAEIIIITLGSVQDAPLLTQFAIISGLGVLFTAGVYGIVAGIVKLDDAGLYLLASNSEPVRIKHFLGRCLLQAAPSLMRLLSFAGTLAMFLVGGSILLHGLPFAHHWQESLSANAAALPFASSVATHIIPIVMDCIVGLTAGVLTYFGVAITKSIRDHRSTQDDNTKSDA